MPDNPQPVANPTTNPVTEPPQPVAPAPTTAATPAAPVPQTAPLQQQQQEKKPVSPVTVVSVLIVLAMAAIFGWRGVFTGSAAWNQLEITASTEEEPSVGEPKTKDNPPPKTWKVKGHVRDHGEPVVGAKVSLTGSDRHGSTYAHGISFTTEADGNFTFTGVSQQVGNGPNNQIVELKIEAYKGRESIWETSRQGTHTFPVGKQDSTLIRAKEISFSIGFLLPVACFLVSLGWVGYRLIGSGMPTWSHFVPCGSALLGTGFMIGLIAFSIMWINSHVASGEVRSLGFLYFHENTYVKDQNPDWVISMTAPPPREVVAPKEGVTPAPIKPITGFGAPLWVVFVSVIGAGLLNMVLIIREVTTAPDGDETKRRTEYLGRFRTILEHQFFVLFAPLGGVFLYQMLVIAGAANQQVTVAIAILGAGATLNGLLVRAVRVAEEWVRSGGKTNGNG